MPYADVCDFEYLYPSALISSLRKVGVPVFRKDESKAEGYRYSKSQASAYGKIGFEYIF